MSPNDIQAALEAGDLIRVYMTSGEEHDILDQRTVMVGETALIVGVYGENQPFPRWKMFALKNIAAVKPLTPAELS